MLFQNLFVNSWTKYFYSVSLSQPLRLLQSETNSILKPFMVSHQTFKHVRLNTVSILCWISDNKKFSTRINSVFAFYCTWKHEVWLKKRTSVSRFAVNWIYSKAFLHAIKPRCVFSSMGDCHSPKTHTVDSRPISHTAFS